MEGPRACHPDELDNLRVLENTVFRSSNDSCMFREFPTLFHESNCDRLRVIVENGRPVSAIAYVARTAVIHGNTLRMGLWEPWRRTNRIAGAALRRLFSKIPLSK